MGKYFDVLEGLKFAWSKFLQGELLKWSAFQYIGSLVISIVLAILIIVLLFVFVPADALFASMKASPTTFFGMPLNNMDPDSLHVFALLQTIITIGGLPLIASLIVLFAIYFLADFIWVLYSYIRINRAALQSSDIKIPAQPPRLIDYIVLNIRVWLLDTFCWYDKRLLIPAIVFFALTALLILFLSASHDLSLAFLASIPLLLAIIAWVIASAIHGIRTVFSQFMLLRGDGQEGKMPRKSFDLVKGQTIELFLALFFGGVTIFVASIALGFFTTLISFIPCIGSIIEFVLDAVISVLIVSFSQAYMTSMFKFYSPYEKQGKK